MAPDRQKAGIAEAIAIRRTELVCPASSEKMMSRAAASEADEVVFDLEDGCAWSQKASARQKVVEALNALEFKNKIRAYRVNGAKTGLMEADLAEVIPAAGSRIDAVILSKVGDPDEIFRADEMLSRLEQAANLPPGRIRIEAMIESAPGLVHCEQIAAASPRMASLVFGAVDYAGDVGARSPGWEHLLYARSRIVAAARAAGIDPIDGVTLNFRDLQNCRRDAESAAQLGFAGKWAIHPEQVPVINQAFTPSQEELSRARELLELFERAQAESNSGIFVYKDEMVDAASLHIERRKLAIARRAGLL